MKRICFGLHGGIGNCLFALPAIKALSREAEVLLYVEGDIAGTDLLFARCQYAKQVSTIPKADEFLVAHTAPVAFVRQGIKYTRCGIPYGTKEYTVPEWVAVKMNAVENAMREDVTDWIKDLLPSPKLIDVGMVPCSKLGSEWERKRWKGYSKLAEELFSRGLSVEAFGVRDEVEEAGLLSLWRGQTPLHALPESLNRCRVMVGNDAGITHLASSIGIPTAMIFTATSTVKGDPVGPSDINRKISLSLNCSPCQSVPRWKSCTDWKCREVRVETIIGFVLELFQKGTVNLK